MEGTLFVNGFLSYLIVYFVFIAAIVIAFVIGFTLRKNKNAKMITADGAGNTEDTAKTDEEK